MSDNTENLENPPWLDALLRTVEAHQPESRVCPDCHEPVRTVVLYATGDVVWSHVRRETDRDRFPKVSCHEPPPFVDEDEDEGEYGHFDD